MILIWFVDLSFWSSLLSFSSYLYEIWTLCFSVADFYDRLVFLNFEQGKGKLFRIHKTLSFFCCCECLVLRFPGPVSSHSLVWAISLLCLYFPWFHCLLILISVGPCSGRAAWQVSSESLWGWMVPTLQGSLTTCLFHVSVSALALRFSCHAFHWLSVGPWGFFQGSLAISLLSSVWTPPPPCGFCGWCWFALIHLYFLILFAINIVHAFLVFLSCYLR